MSESLFWIDVERDAMRKLLLVGKETPGIVYKTRGVY